MNRFDIPRLQFAEARYYTFVSAALSITLMFNLHWMPCLSCLPMDCVQDMHQRALTHITTQAHNASTSTTSYHIHSNLARAVFHTIAIHLFQQPILLAQNTIGNPLQKSGSSMFRPSFGKWD
ncbi:uncharacterized protein LAESUDRAFT_257955 [Laetiporus sulphureus 93-53]|uniref:Uncharacterized protein n=1 Tax=Laetiporus sulphureus 93-53 TaxID=1314785 RepID=A0A165H3R1_9APHY|nr:uncharacterized protein LAESUDRAFT_257955 [Laetiporus sulphureus 93-53]KZT11202.1 hypothetical protein LAESUDRAFT_257955 [Laetiporus sulphureus 93-53]